MKTFIVDDDAISRRLYETTGLSLGLEIISYADAESAWEACQRELPPLLVLDWSLPRMDGLELCRRVRALAQGARCIILMVTARNRPEELQAVLQAGADDYLAKPVDPVVLRVRLAIAARQARLLLQRKQTEDALRQSEERFQLVARATNEAIWDWDLATNRMGWNEGVQNLLGYAPEEVKPDASWWFNNIHPQDRDRVVAHIKKFWSATDLVWADEYLFRCGNGFYMTVADRAYLVRGPQGKALRLVGSMMDITERKQAEAKIQKLAAFAQFNPNAVLELAADGTLTYFNDATLKLTSVLNKKHPLEILPTDTAAIVKECLATGANNLRRETHAAGRIIAWSFFPIPAINAVHSYAVDVTERINLETQLRQSQKLDSIGQLSAGVAHDFNNILTIIQGYASLLLSAKTTDPKMKEPLTQISVAGERAANLTRQLLLFSRKQGSEQKNLDFGEVIANMIKMLQRILGEDIALEFGKVPGLPPVYADAGMLEQVIMNLAVNARDAMPKGGQLTLATQVEEIAAGQPAQTPLARPGRFVSMSVTDTGSGIPAEILPKIFEPFFTTKEAGKGTGLGLATVFSIVKQHQGWVEVASAVGKGTTFKTFLPVSTRADTAGADLLNQGVVRGGTETILLAEDDLALRGLARAVLQRYGYHVLEARTAIESLGIWAAHRDKIQMLLTDIVLPDGMSGRELAARLLAQKPGLKVIYSSGYSVDLEAQGVVLKEGCNFLQKPFPIERLARIVRSLLDEKSAG